MQLAELWLTYSLPFLGERRSKPSSSWFWGVRCRFLDRVPANSDGRPRWFAWKCLGSWAVLVPAGNFSKDGGLGRTRPSLRRLGLKRHRRRELFSGRPWSSARPASLEQVVSRCRCDGWIQPPQPEQLPVEAISTRTLDHCLCASIWNSESFYWGGVLPTSLFGQRIDPAHFIKFLSMSCMTNLLIFGKLRMSIGSLCQVLQIEKLICTVEKDPDFLLCNLLFLTP